MVREFAALVAVIDGVFAIGGEEEELCHSTVSYYDIKNNFWIVGYPQLNTARSGASACVLKATVYVFCGFNEEN